MKVYKLFILINITSLMTCCLIFAVGFTGAYKIEYSFLKLHFIMSVYMFGLMCLGYLFNKLLHWAFDYD